MLPTCGPVALGALRAARVASGETVLVHAAGGAIGHLAVQLAKLSGAGTVIATASDDRKLALARECGADVTVNYADPSWPDLVRAAAPGGVDVVLESAGGDVLLHSLDLLAPFGRLVVYGVAGGVLTDIPESKLFTLRTVTGFSLLAWRAAAPTAVRAAMAELSDLFSTATLTTATDSTFPLVDAARAHELLDARAQRGRILLMP